ncbi:hypothetical protein [Rhodococcoides kroppenstedtii]|uniref:hypothetical protein n=1 Tax=Rhodococcoides kroppenstedtii TaxID=293050 RepID=UPI001BDED1C0|nr:hypothetical protein [Rhodococcus kroppenstedtii]MBT1192053.1 hypothetical protein [Rhodococcus kroppenstedtii]
MSESVKQVPDWATHKAGGKVRVALWLAAEVGEHGVFTKASVRAAFPGVEQIDRRMRDLRGDGWVIATYREDRSLAQDELRLISIGGHVWERNYRSPSKDRPGEKERNAVLSRDMWRCRFCGTAAGDVYPDDRLRRATLMVTTATMVAGIDINVSSCERCLKSSLVSASREAVDRTAQSLNEPSKDVLLRFLALDAADAAHLQRTIAVISMTGPEVKNRLLEALESAD